MSVLSLVLNDCASFFFYCFFVERITSQILLIDIKRRIILSALNMLDLYFLITRKIKSQSLIHRYSMWIEVSPAHILLLLFRFERPFCMESRYRTTELD